MRTEGAHVGSGHMKLFERPEAGQILQTRVGDFGGAEIQDP